MIKSTLLIFIFFTVSINASAQKNSNYTVSSPNGNISVELLHRNSTILYTLLKEGNPLVNPSKLSILPHQKTEITGSTINSKNETWQPVWGQFSNIRNHYNELVLNLNIEGISAKLYVRVFDNGIGLRYEIKDYTPGEAAIFSCEYKLNESNLFYSANGESEPYGPLSSSEIVNSKKDLKLLVPVVVEQPENIFLSFLESDLYVAPEFGVINFEYNTEEKTLTAINKTQLTGNHTSTPWRVILINNKIGDLLTNTVPLNLATPSQLKDDSWVQPGKSLWDWRVHGYKTEDGFVYGTNTESYIRFIDFAADKGIEYFLIDASWRTKVSTGHFEVSEDLDMEKVSSYAKENGVKIMLYYDRRKGNFGDEKLFPYYESMGMSGIKYGFMKDNVPFSKEAIQRSAESHLLINFHDNPVPFTGIERTFPNAITKEYCHAQQDARKAFTPEAFIKMALINAIQGPLDMTNGNFDITGINSGSRLKGPRKPNTYFSTVTSEVARTLIIYSGFVCIPDAPEAYNKKADLFEFIQNMPVGQWDESIVLDSKMNTYISTARRHGESWFIGSVTNTEARTLDIKLDFLKKDKTYLITYYEDTSETHGMKNPEAYQIRTEKINYGKHVKAIMAPGGGHCMWIRPE
ncbi:glycoside hydrolase family 97 catalytic domain-containing protein [Winogradskyella eckloniae]|nr:glycoside hydrolase family 97 catalytic domain-containing protein [Winogradskyella eckloniae]